MAGQPHGGSPSIQKPDYWWYVARSALLESALAGFVGRPTRALDVGSADGPSVGWLREGDWTTVSLDVDPRGLGEGGVCGSALALPFADATFDLVTAFDVVEHCDPEAAVMTELVRVLRPGARLLMSVPAYQWAWSDHDVANGHHRRYTRRRAVAAVEAAGLRVDRATYAFTAVFPFFAAERVLRRIRARAGRTSVSGPTDVVAVPDLPPVVERALSTLSKADEKLLARGNLPFGSSVFLAATKVA